MSNRRDFVIGHHIHAGMVQIPKSKIDKANRLLGLARGSKDRPDVKSTVPKDVALHVSGSKTGVTA